MKASAPERTSLVLLGGGHAHVTVLKALGMRPLPGLRLTLIAKELAAPYSGMLPGLVAGHYRADECHIDLVRLAQFAGARLIDGSAIGIDRASRRVLITDRPPLAYDLLSIDVGITPALDDIAGAAEHALAVKPISTFVPRWQALAAAALRPDGPRRFVLVGAGPAGFELILALRQRFRTAAAAAGIAPDAFSFQLIGGDQLLPAHPPRAQALARAALALRDVQLIEHDPVVAIEAGGVATASGRRLPADAVLVTTKAAPPAWFATTDLPRDPDGFLAVRPSLQLLDDDDIFAVGDCASVLAHPRPKAGVFAVRQGPPLAANLRRRAQGLPVEPFRPQREFLTLLSTGDRHAIAARGRFALAGGWVWRWKDRIDRAFMRRFDELPDMAGADDAPMRCAGCGAKVGPAILGRALGRLAGEGEPAARDDAAIIDDGGDRLRLETVDFFRAFWPEPYLFGALAANHALSDIYAMGGRPEQAQVIAVLPYARPRASEEDLYQLLAGARATLDQAGVALIGGHSSEGAELALGFAVSGSVARGRLLRKGGLQPGDRLILTRPLGSGVLFAGWMRGQARGAAIQAALAAMGRSNGPVADRLAEAGCHGLTDVTGFGLIGHLVEMLDASGQAARLEPAAIPFYPDAEALAAAGIASSLLPDNLAHADRLTGKPPGLALQTLLFDPQTAGGLLAGVPASAAAAVLAVLRAGPAPAAAIIGEVRATAPGEAGLIELREAAP